jgi:hypothetical protein
MNKHTIRKSERKDKTLQLKRQGYSIRIISKKVGVSQTTIYNYLQEEYDKNRYPILREDIKRVLLQGDLESYLMDLSYRDISVLRRKFKVYGYSKDSKIKALLKYFEHYSILGLYPENLTRSEIKKAFYKKVKKVHPDMNKSLDRSGKEFQEVYNSYTYLLARV